MLRERWIKEFQVYLFLSELQPGQRDVGGNGKSEEGADSQEHRVGVDKGEQEDADGRQDKGAVHNKEGVDKGKVRQPPEQVHSIDNEIESKDNMLFSKSATQMKQI